VKLQDYVALGACLAALAWLVHRLVLRYLPAAKKPDVTTAQLVRRSRERRDCH
jgi:hypothetical protein